MLRRALSAAAVVLVALGMLSSTASATFPGKNGKVAYRADHGTDTNYRIYIRTKSGGAETALTPDGTDASNPTFTADGSRIVFQKGGDIWIMWSDGTHKRNLTQTPLVDEYGATVSPSGRWVAWFQGAGPAELHEMKLDGSGEEVVGTLPGEGADLSWSPNGRWLATYAYRNGSFDLVVVNAQTGAKNWITKTALMEYAADWSPDGSRLVYAAGETSTVKDLFTIKRDGTGRRRLTTTHDLDESQPVWSPDGRKILFVQRIVATNSRDLAIMLAKKDAEQTLIGAIPGDDFDPSWQPTQPEI